MAKVEVKEQEVANGGRFHAWQSALLFTAIFVLHLIFSWSAFLSWTFFVGDLVLIGYLTMRAYRDGKSLRKDDASSFADTPLQRTHWTDAKFPSSADWRAASWMTNNHTFRAILWSSRYPLHGTSWHCASYIIFN